MAVKQLNQEQQMAISTIDGSTLVLAPPGSGKTQILAARITNMLSGDQGILPNMILSLTFTEAGVVAMRKRLVEFLGPAAHKIAIHTFHSFCNEIIQNNPDYFNVREAEPASELERIEIAYQIIDELEPDNPLKRLRGDVYYDAHRLLNLFQLMKDENYSTADFSERIEFYLKDLHNREEYIYKRGNKNKLIRVIDPETGQIEERPIQVGDVKQHLIDKEIKKMQGLKAASDLLEKYNSMLKAKSRYDYSDMLGWVLKAWSTDEYFLMNFQERYQYILVDEFQDTNKMQLTLLNELLSFWDDANVFAVGDPDQCLYEFNGARLLNIIEFKEKHNARTHFLVQNYRSTSQIIEAAMKVIRNNDERLSNVLDITNDMYSAFDVEGDTPLVYEFASTATETAWIVGYLESMVNAGMTTDLSSVAIIYRNHKQADSLIRQMEARGIAYNIKRSINVLETVVVKQMLEMLRYIVNFDQLKIEERDSALFRILHFSFLGNDIEKIHKYYLSLQDKDSRSRKPVDYIKTEDKLSELTNLYHNVPLVVLMNHIIEDTGLLENVLKSPEYIQTMQYINTFFTWMKGEAFKDTDLNGRGLLEMIGKMKDNSLYLPTVDVAGFNKGVNLMTAHGSKGLEFDTVILMGCNRNVWEGSRAGSTNFTLPDTITLSVEENKLESARRLFYVAMTRAEKNLVITHALSNDEGKLLEPSQFIQETELNIESVDSVDMSAYMAAQFRQSKIKLNILENIIREKLKDFSMSVSALNKYMECPTSFYFENIVRVPFVAHSALIFGNAIHLSMKMLYDAAKQKKTMSFDEFHEVFENYVMRNKSQMDKAELERRLILGKQVLTSAYGTYFVGSNKITLNEYKIKRVIVEGIPMKGDIDKIEFHGALCDLDDYKTGDIIAAKKKSKGPTDKNPDGGEYWRQGVFYKIMFGKLREDWKFRSYRLDILTPEKVVPVPVKITTEDEVVVLGLVKKTYNNIMDLQFSNGCDKENCKWCSLMKH